MFIEISFIDFYTLFIPIQDMNDEDVIKRFENKFAIKSTTVTFLNR